MASVSSRIGFSVSAKRFVRHPIRYSLIDEAKVVAAEVFSVGGLALWRVPSHSVAFARNFFQPTPAWRQLEVSLGAMIFSGWKLS